MSIIIEIECFIQQLRKASMNCRKIGDNSNKKRYGIPLGRLVEEALACQIKTAESWSEKKEDTESILLKTIKKINA